LPKKITILSKLSEWNTQQVANFTFLYLFGSKNVEVWNFYDVLNSSIRITCKYFNWFEWGLEKLLPKQQNNVII